MCSRRSKWKESYHVTLILVGHKVHVYPNLNNNLFLIGRLHSYLVHNKTLSHIVFKKRMPPRKEIVEGTRIAPV